MTIIKGSLRYTDHNDIKIIIEPGTDSYKQWCDVAQEIWHMPTRQWTKIAANYPAHLNDDETYRVYLDGQIVPWWSKADRIRGWVDVCVGILEPDHFAIQMEIKKHRLFGVIKFEPKVLSEVL